MPDRSITFPKNLDRLASKQEISLMVAELTKLPTAKDGERELRDYLEILDGCTAYGLANALKDFLHGKHGEFMPSPTKVRIAHDEIMKPLYRARAESQQRQATLAQTLEARESRDAIASQITPEVRARIAKLHQAAITHLDKQSAEMDADLPRADSKTPYLDRQSFRAMQRAGVNLHRGD